MVDIKFNWKVIVAVLAVAIFIFEIVALGVLGSGSRDSGGGTTTGELLTGNAQFNGIIRTYDPLLGTNLQLDTATLDQIRAMNGVKEVTSTQDGTAIITETRDDVYPIGYLLRQKNITVYAIANIVPTSNIEVELENGSKINASAGQVAFRVITEPFVDVDTEVTINMVAQISDGKVINYGSAGIVSEEKKLLTNATVLDIDYIYTYSIPWEKRDSVNVGQLNQYGQVDYKKKNTVFFKQPLTINEVMAKRNISYITYIDQYSIGCSENFTNISRVISDFSGKNITFDSSTLKIASNRSLGLNYSSSSVVYHYKVSVPAQINGTALEVSEIEFQSDKVYPTNSKINLEITGTVIGNKMVVIRNAAIK